MDHRAKILIFVVLALPGRLVLAAVQSWGYTIEAKAANADQIVIGRVSSVSADSLTAASPDHWQNVVVTVRQTLKGSSSPEVAFRARVWSTDPFWNSGHEALFFLQTGPRYATRGWSSASFPLVLDQCDGYGPIDLVRPSRRSVLLADLRTDPTADLIVQRVRSHCDANPNRLFEEIPGPPGLDANFGPGFPSLLEVSIDPATEDVARRWAESQDARTRWDAARILRHTRSPTNAAALQLIAVAPLESSEGFFARAMALDTLEGWGFPRAFNRDEGSTASCLMQASFVLVPAAVLAAVCFVRMRRSTPRYSRFALSWRIAVVLFGSALTLAWPASHLGGVGYRGSHIEAGIWRGDVVLVYRSHDEITRPIPGRLVTAGGLWTIRDCVTRRYYEGLLPWQITAGPDQPSDSVYPQWTTLYGFVIPVWQLIFGLLAVMSTIWCFGVLRRMVQNRRTGFPVIIAPKSGTDVNLLG